MAVKSDNLTKLGNPATYSNKSAINYVLFIPLANKEAVTVSCSSKSIKLTYILTFFSL